MKSLTLALTGTDTGVGKTYVACALLAAARRRGLSACGYKPVASGCARSADGLRNEDALGMIAAAASTEPYAAINPYAFAPAIAPHIAAAEAGQPIRAGVLDAAYGALAARHTLLVVEGAGGWRVPFGADFEFCDWVAGHGWPVVLVVGLRLGCINHALLSAESIAARTRLLGWVANHLPPAMPCAEENRRSLERLLPAPLLGEFGAEGSAPAASADLALTRIIAAAA